MSLNRINEYCTDGSGPNPLVRVAGGDFYGTTSGGGVNGVGTFFKITTSGALTTLYSFCSQSGCTDGSTPNSLVQAANGDFYGTTIFGGANGDFGTVFEITPNGTLTTLYSFCSQSNCTDGKGPFAGLVQGTDSNFYGTTLNGGAYAEGTVFQITPSGTLTTLYSFCAQTGCPDGQNPQAALGQATDGNFYGTTPDGGASDEGTIFKITASGTLTTLYTFVVSSTNGYSPQAALVQATNGDLYGTAWYGGANGVGTVFSLSVGLGPFVKTQTTSGKVGTAVKILGTNLTGATSVTFNGTAAAFTVSATGTAISTAVPPGATTGTVQVVTPNGTLSSNVPFRVLP